MARNGTGTYIRLYNYQTDQLNGIDIEAVRVDGELDGMATALSDSICRDGQTALSNNIPFNGFKLTGLGDATAATDALNRQSADARYYTQTQSNALYQPIGAYSAHSFQTSNYVLALADAGTLVRMSVATSNTLTVPPNSSVAFPLRTWVHIVQWSTGTTTIVAGSGVSVRSVGGTLNMASRYSGGILIKVDTDEWWLARTV